MPGGDRPGRQRVVQLGHLRAQLTTRGDRVRFPRRAPPATGHDGRVGAGRGEGGVERVEPGTDLCRLGSEFGDLCPCAPGRVGGGQRGDQSDDRVRVHTATLSNVCSVVNQKCCGSRVARRDQAIGVHGDAPDDAAAPRSRRTDRRAAPVGVDRTVHLLGLERDLDDDLYAVGVVDQPVGSRRQLGEPKLVAVARRATPSSRQKFRTARIGPSSGVVSTEWTTGELLLGEGRELVLRVDRDASIEGEAGLMAGEVSAANAPMLTRPSVRGRFSTHDLADAGSQRVEDEPAPAIGGGSRRGQIVGDEVRDLLRAPDGPAVGRRRRAAADQGCARSGRAGRLTRHPVRVGGGASLPGGVQPLLGAGGVPRRLQPANLEDPAGSRDHPHRAAVQPPGAHRRAGVDARPRVRRTGRVRQRGVVQRGRARRLPGQPGREARGVAGGVGDGRALHGRDAVHRRRRHAT